MGKQKECRKEHYPQFDAMFIRDDGPEHGWGVYFEGCECPLMAKMGMSRIKAIIVKEKHQEPPEPSKCCCGCGCDNYTDCATSGYCTSCRLYGCT